jgi:hypothetical protein
VVRRWSAAALVVFVDACIEVPIPGEPTEFSRRDSCPLPPITLPTGLIRLPGQTFCVCPEGLVDDDALFTFDIYVEDPDVDREGLPLDDLYAVFLLDVPPDATDVGDYIAYRNYLDPNEPARLVLLGSGSYLEPIERPRTNLKSWALGVDERVDLCNNNEGSKLPMDEEQRLHSLRLVVTDRPWYVPVAFDDKGLPIADDQGGVVREGEPLVGVPDIPGGATYAVAHYVFECLTEDMIPDANVCSCVNPMEEP